MKSTTYICKHFSHMIDTYIFKDFDIILKKERRGKEKERDKEIDLKLKKINILRADSLCLLDN